MAPLPDALAASSWAPTSLSWVLYSSGDHRMWRGSLGTLTFKGRSRRAQGRPQEPSIPTQAQVPGSHTGRQGRRSHDLWEPSWLLERASGSADRISAGAGGHTVPLSAQGSAHCGFPWESCLSRSFCLFTWTFCNHVYPSKRLYPHGKATTLRDL